MEQAKQSSKCKIERRFLPLKALNFAFSTGSGCLLPFIPVYMKQLGLTSTETGLIYGFMPFVTFFASPLFGMMADKTRRHKLVMISSFIIIGLFYNLLLLVPARQTQRSDSRSVNVRMWCGQPGLYLWKYDNTKTVSKAPSIETEKKYDKHIEDMLNVYDKDNNKYIKMQCTSVDNNKSVDNPCLFVKEKQNFYQAESVLSVSKENSTLLLALDQISPITSDLNSSTIKHCQIYEVLNITFESMMFSTINCFGVSDFNCELTYIQDNTSTESEPATSSSTFYLFLLIFLVASVVQASMVSMIDSVVYSYLGEERRSDYGKQRMWGTIAYIIAAPLSSTLMDKTSSSTSHVNFQWSFHAYFGCIALTALVTYFLKFEKIKASNFFVNVTKLFRYPEIVVFLVINMFIGLLSVLFQVFLFVHLKNLDSPQTVLGLALVACCIPETIMMEFSGKLIKKLGCVACLCLALLALAIRYFAYSLLTNPWYVLFIEPLHAFNYGLMHAAATTYASEMAPKGMSATMQGIRGGFMTGLGKGIGGLVTGKLFDTSGLGAVWTFRVYAIVCVLVMVAYATIHCIFFKKKDKAGNNDVPFKLTKDQQASEKLVTLDDPTNNTPGPIELKTMKQLTPDTS